MKVTIQEFTNFCNSGEQGYIDNLTAIDLVFYLVDNSELLEREDFALLITNRLKDCGFTPLWMSKIIQYIRENI